MAETQTGQPLDVTQLGPHIGGVISKHLERHQQDASQAREAAEKRRILQERQEKLDGLREKLKPIMQAERLKGVAVTKPYEVQRLETGTVVAAVLSGQSADGDSSHAVSVRHAARELVNTEKYEERPRDSAGADYLHRGPISDDPEFSNKIIPHKNKVVRRGLTVSLTLETPHQEGDLQPTREDSLTFVASVIDPESIFVVEELNPEHPDMLYGKVIGPNDERFQPVMGMVERVAQGVAAEGQMQMHQG